MKWVFLADPESYGWDQLVRDGRTVWDGVANASAQNNLRRCKPGDLALIYHTAPDKAIQGWARVVTEAYADPHAPERVVVDVEPVSALKRALPLAEIRADPLLADMKFVRMPRVAVQPVSDAEWERVLAVAGQRAPAGP